MHVHDVRSAPEPGPQGGDLMPGLFEPADVVASIWTDFKIVDDGDGSKYNEPQSRRAVTFGELDEAFRDRLARMESTLLLALDYLALPAEGFAGKHGHLMTSDVRDRITAVLYRPETTVVEAVEEKPTIVLADPRDLDGIVDADPEAKKSTEQDRRDEADYRHDEWEG